MLTVGNATGRIISQTQDKWGRWVSQTFLGTAGRTITIVSAYQVVTDIARGGTTTATTQQYSLLVHDQDSTKAPRAAFRRDLKTYLQQCRQRGDELILVGDFNETIGNDADGMVSVVQGLDMMNMMGVRHTSELPTTYARGRRCLDYGFATANVCTSLEACGYKSFGHRFSLDHRAYFFDFGTQIQPLSKFEPRLSYSTNAKQVTKYLRRMDAIMKSCDAYARGDRLALPGRRDAFAERLDSDVLNGSLVSERALPVTHAPAWSKALATARAQVATLQKLMSCMRHSKPYPQNLLEQYQRHCPEYPLPQTRAVCQTHLNKARMKVKTIVDDSFSQRDTEFRNKIESLESSGAPKDRNHAHVVRQIIHKERKQNMFRKLKQLRSTGGATGVTRLEIPIPADQDPKSCQNWQSIDIPSEVLSHLQARNQRHFGQAHGTPFTVPPLSDDLGFCADTPEEAEALLNGDYNYGKVDDPTVRLLLQHLTQIHSLAGQLRTVTISEGEFRSKLRVWRESTSTSPSGQHMGRFKSLVARHEYSDVTDEDSPFDIGMCSELDNIQRKLLRLRVVQIVNYASSTGHSYRRWQTIANSHIMKEPGNIKIHRTRVIHIYEADYNLALGIKWREAMHRADEANAFNDGQYGSRPNRQAQDPVLLEELQFDISRVSRKTLVLTDATSCYDRIIPSLAMVASRKFGMPESVTLANARTLENAHYRRIRTDLGLAPTGYSHSSDNPIYGTGQGSANSPMLWLFLDSILYDCYDSKTHPAVYCTPDHLHRITLGMAGFVDDSNGQTNQFEHDERERTWELILQYAQKNAQLWINLLYASGGALELSKCSFHLLRWSVSISGAPVLTVPEDNPDLVARDPQTSESHHIPMLSPYSAHKTLGHYKEPSGSQAEQTRQLKKLCTEQVSFLWKSPLTRLEAWYFYKACFLPSVSYPLANSYFSKASLQTIQQTAMSIIVAKCGFNRHMKLEVLYGPIHLGGAAFYELYDQQGIGQINMFLRHWRLGQTIGRLLRVLLSWTNYSAGLSVSVLADVTTPLPHLEAKWLGSMRDYLNHTRAWIEVDDAGIVPLEREHDDYIMDLILQSEAFQPAQIRILNYCRLYLGAVTLSDLTTTTGIYLDNAKLKGHTSRMSIVTRWLKIHQERPSEVHWTLWQKANLLWSSRKGRLNQPLGRWLRSNDERRVRCPAYVNGNTLALRVHDEFQLYTVEERSRRVGSQIVSSIRYENLHPAANPVEVYDSPDGQWMMRIATERVDPQEAPVFDSFQTFINTLPSWEGDLLQHVVLALDPAYICFDLQLYFYAGSDGSVKHETNGSFGWMLSNTERDQVAWAMGPARCAKVNSYRAECTGMLSLLRFLIQLSNYTNSDEPWRGLVGTDSQSMIDRRYVAGTGNTSKQLASLDVLDAEWDLLVEIQDALRELPGVDITYVKSHQDDKRAYASLPLMAQLNVDADRLAGQYHKKHGAHRPAFSFMAPNTGAFLLTDEGTVTSNISSALRIRSTSTGLEEYLRTKNKWDYCTFEAVNCTSHGNAVKALLPKRIHLTKFLHDALPTHHHANLQDGGTRKCVACGTSDKTTDHIFRCLADSRVAWRTAWWKSIESFHEAYATHPLL